MIRPTRALAAAAVAASCFVARPAAPFPHVVQPGETLAQIAERIYGKVEMERLLVAANGLDLGDGVRVVPGMRLEVPALGHHRVTAGETWAMLARDFLGHPDRSDVIAVANGSMPWLTPTDGQEIVIPYNLRYVATAQDTILTIAYRFLGDRDKAYVLDRYNHLGGEPVRRGDVILIPLVELPLTPEGRAEAALAGAVVRSEGGGRALESQRRADAELPQLASDLRHGRYVDAVARCNRLLGAGDLSRPQLAAVHRGLTEAYVALDAIGLATAACAAWREADPSVVLDPIEHSPKILRACTAGPSPAPPLGFRPDAGGTTDGATSRDAGR